MKRTKKLLTCFQTQERYQITREMLFLLHKKCEKLNLTVNEKGVNDVINNKTLTPFLSNFDIFKVRSVLKAKKFDHLLD